MVPGSSPGGPTNSEKATDFLKSVAFFHRFLRIVFTFIVSQQRIRMFADLSGLASILTVIRVRDSYDEFHDFDFYFARLSKAL